MRKTLKIILSTLSILLIILIISTIGLVSFVNPNDFKSPIAKAISAKTGRPFTINGDITWSLLPLMGFQIQQAQFDNPNNLGLKGPFAEIGTLKVNIRLLPLLKHQFQIGAIQLKDLHLMLYRSQSGQSNWQGFYQHRQPTHKYHPKLKVKISSLEILNGSIEFIDKKHNTALTLTNIHLKTNPIQPNQPFTINVSGHIKSQHPDIETKAQFSALITPKWKDGLYLAQNLHLNATLLKWQDNINTHTNAASRSLKINGNINWNANKHYLKLDNLSIYSLNLQLLGDLEGLIGDTKNPIRLTGHIKVLPFSPNEALHLLEIASPFAKPDKAFSRLSGDATLNIDTHRISLFHLKAKIDQTRLSGNGAFAWKSPNKQLNFSVDLDRLVAENYILKPSTSPKNQHGNTQQQSSIQYLLSQIGKIKGKVAIKQFSANHVTATNVVLAIKGSKGIINLSPTTANIYQGHLKSDITLDLRKPTTAYITNGALSGVKTDDLLKSFSNQPPAITGEGSLSARLTSLGNDTKTITAHLNGLGSLHLTNGYIKKIDAVSILSKATALLNKQTVINTKGTQQTAYDKITANFYISNGIIHSSDFLLTSPTLEIRGKGSVNLNDKTLQVQLSIKGIKNIIVKNAYEHRQLNTWWVPVSVTGSLNKPIITPDFTAIGKRALLKKIEDSKAVQDTLKKIPKNIGKTLNQLISH